MSPPWRWVLGILCPPLLWWNFVARMILERTRALFCRHLAVLLEANVDLPSALSAFGEDLRTRHPLRPIYRHVAARLRAGWSLTDALAELHRFFPPYAVRIVEVAEKSGALAPTLHKLAERFRKQQLTLSSAKSSMLIFVASLMIQIGIGSFIAIKVLPVFLEIFIEFKGPSYAHFELMEWSIRAAVLCYFVLGAASLAGMFFFHMLENNGWIGRQAGRIALHTPMVRRIFAQWQLAQAAAILTPLLESDVPLHEALEDSAAPPMSGYYAAVFRNLAARTAAGSSLSDALLAFHSSVIPPDFAGRVSAGEGAGLLPEALDALQANYERRLAKVVKVLADAAAPLLVVIPGIIIFLFVVTLHIALIGVSLVILDQM